MMFMDVKGNPGKPGVSQWWLVAGLGAALLQLALVVCLNERLPAPLPRTAPPRLFSAERAYRHLLDLTDLGPRVAGSYACEVAAVRVAARALARMARDVAPHHALDVDVYRYDGNYSITFLDGMSTAYRGAAGVVARLRGAGARATTAVLINCHLDSVPDSPGAHDDALGCAVALETLRALGAAPHAHRHDTLLLLNAAEENIMQASHAFLAQHPWAAHARVFVNLEACGAGGRELLFRATHDYWLLQEYASRAPHPRLASLAQELFEWGLVPADTDYRMFAAHNLSGVDFAWVAEGYAYHTRLDDATRVSLGAAQRTGDNVLRLLQGILVQRALAVVPAGARAAPLYFDVLGLYGVVLSARDAAAAGLVLLLAAAGVTWHQVPPYLGRGVWLGAVGRCAGRVCAGALAGAGAAAASGALLAVLDARMLAHARPELLLLQAALPGVTACWYAVRRLQARERLRAVLAPHRALLAGTACRGLAALGLAAALAGGLRSGVLAAAWLLGWSLGAGGRAALAPALYWTGSARDLLSVLLPGAARAAPHAHPDILVMVVAGFAAVVAVSWLLPTVLAANNIDKVLACMCAVWALGAALCVTYARCAGAGAAYSAERPQRQFALHTRAGPVWLPDVDVNSRATHRLLFPGPLQETNCSQLFCGAPYFLPALSLVPSGQWAPGGYGGAGGGGGGDGGDHAAINVTLARDHPAPTTARVNVTVVGEKHIVIIVSPAAGGLVTRLGPVAAPAPGPKWGERQTYMITLFDARPKQHRTPWHIPIYIEHSEALALRPACELSVAGHAMSGARAKSRALRQLEARAPAWLALSAWTADLHLLQL